MSIELTDKTNVKSTDFDEMVTFTIPTKDGYDHLDIPLWEFCEIVRYVMTNTDLKSKDPRRFLLKRMKSLTIEEGHNEGGERYQINFGSPEMKP